MQLEVNEHRQVGPPGTGKTTWIVDQISKAVAAGRRPILCSLTKAASEEARSRMSFGSHFEPSQVRTLHAHAYHTLGRPAMFSNEDHLKDWNEHCTQLKQEDWKLTTAILAEGRKSEEDLGPKSKFPSLADQMYKTSTVYRAKMLNPETVPAETRAFDEAFTRWRRMAGLHDFTDLIERCLNECPSPQGDPDVIFVDEAQDHDRLELTLIRKWACSADWLVVVGDPDQNLYEWKGADPQAFYSGEVPAERSKVLSQSYRVPRAVHRVAMRMINRVNGRKQISYEPRDFDGEVRRVSLKFRMPDQFVSQVERVTQHGKTAMILTTCRFQLGGIIKALRERGLPFHNPFARHRGDFNPLSRNGTTAGRRVMNYLKPHAEYWGEKAELWTWDELASWIDPIKTKGLVRTGHKAKLIAYAGARSNETVNLEELDEFLDDDGLRIIQEDIAKSPIDWFRGRLLESKTKSYDYPFQVLKRNGAKGLQDRPKIIIGTIHSVKGGEADVVFIFPDLSPQFEQMRHTNPDPLWRLFYVAITRAREAVFFCERSGPMAIEW